MGWYGVMMMMISDDGEVLLWLSEARRWWRWFMGVMMAAYLCHGVVCRVEEVIGVDRDRSGKDLSFYHFGTRRKKSPEKFSCGGWPKKMAAGRRWPVYVDDIIFGSTKKKLCTEFEKMMHKKFQMSSMGKLTFFLGLQVKQNDDNIASTLIETHKPLLKDADGEDIDEHIYLKGQSKLGLWYPKHSPFDLVAYTDSEYARASLDRKSTTGGIGVNAGDSKLMLLGINLPLLEKVNATRHNLLLLVIVDFLNASSIKYALTVNPTIYTLCIQQFWTTVNVKTINGEVQLQALVDGKKIAVTEASVRRDLQLEDANGVDCLPNATIFEQLTLMGGYIFESMMKNLDSAVKFLMYLRFEQVFLNNQLEGMETHNRIYIAPSHTKMVFANMKRQGKDFSGRVTSLFPTMVIHSFKKGTKHNEAIIRECNSNDSNDPPSQSSSCIASTQDESDRALQCFLVQSVI
ncbi:uncharacterized mitochondrial protein-like protein [Tanacetum coccineum]|uniref:Uncharacterized mitochondrial protein-like protein n=1 Tax=Tanacetum coccineum TaxID=301880 RepID=A0ABQ4XGI0_9ASTR